jgi:Fur family ferric uptake transcriptional regulator
MKRLASERHEAGAPAPGRVRYKSSRGDFSKERSRFVEFLEHKSLKLTRQRELLLEEIFKDDGHFEAEELVERMKHRDARVSRATVYRTLDLLQECLLVEKINFGTSRSFYEHVTLGQHHDHMICTRCGAVIEFFDDRLETLQDEISRKHGMELTHHSMRLFGICKSCRMGNKAN